MRMENDSGEISTPRRDRLATGTGLISINEDLKPLRESGARKTIVR